MHNLIPEMDKPEGSQAPATWTARCRLVVAMHCLGIKSKVIAETLSLTQSRVSVILNDPRALVDIHRMMGRTVNMVQDVQGKLEVLSHFAIEEIASELKSKDENVRQRSAFGILDRAGHGKTIKHKTERPEIPTDLEERLLSALGEEDAVKEAQYEVLDTSAFDLINSDSDEEAA